MSIEQKQARRSLPGHTGQQLLWRLVSLPEELEAIQSLPVQVLHQLIDQIGLEDVGLLIEYLSTTQLATLFDEDLWASSTPGFDERFDAARFGLWLEVMAEISPAFAARKLSELPEDLVVLGLHHVLVVLNLDLIAQWRVMGPSHHFGDAFEKALESALYEEFDAYSVLAKDEGIWDALLEVLLALDATDHALLYRLLERCAHISMELLSEVDELFTLLALEETLEADLAAARAARRVQLGYVAPSDARAFLRLFECHRGEPIVLAVRDPLTRAYFREYNANIQSQHRKRARTAADTALESLLTDLEMAAQPPTTSPTQLRLSKPSKAQETRENLLTVALQRLGEESPSTLKQRQEELQYLANVLCVGCSLQGRRFRPVEAAQAAIATCQLGLMHLLSQEGNGPLALPQQVAALITKYHADQLFQVGWKRLMWQIAIPAAEALLDLLGQATQAHDESQQDTIGALRLALRTQQPWDVYHIWESAPPIFGKEAHQTWLGLFSHMPLRQGALHKTSTQRSDQPGYFEALQDCHLAEEWLAQRGSQQR